VLTNRRQEICQRLVNVLELGALSIPSRHAFTLLTFSACLSFVVFDNFKNAWFFSSMFSSLFDAFAMKLELTVLVSFGPGFILSFMQNVVHLRLKSCRAWKPS
jgi:hypothetical protein